MKCSRPIDLDHRDVVGRGLPPSTTNPQFAQQMTYAVAMTTYERFRMALGRLPEFAPIVRRQRDGRLEIRPHFRHEDNAYYVPDDASLSFGFVKSTAIVCGPHTEGSLRLHLPRARHRGARDGARAARWHASPPDAAVEPGRRRLP